jgi:amino acid transporter
MENLAASFDSIKVYVNLVDNCINFVAMVSFLVFAFGRKNSRIYKHPHLAHLAKIGLTTVAVGSLWSALTLSNPQTSEVILNTGLAVTFVWAAWFHYIEFVAPMKPGKSLPPKKSSKKKR